MCKGEAPPRPAASRDEEAPPTAPREARPRGDAGGRRHTGRGRSLPGPARALPHQLQAAAFAAPAAAAEVATQASSAVRTARGGHELPDARLRSPPGAEAGAGADRPARRPSLLPWPGPVQARP